jgi:hypothetical protein
VGHQSVIIVFITLQNQSAPSQMTTGAPVNNTEPETGATGAIGLTAAMIAQIQEAKFQAALQAELKEIEEATAYRRRKLEVEAEAQERLIKHQLQLKLEFETLAAEKRKLTLDASMDASPSTPAKEMDTEALRLSVVPEGGTFEESVAAGCICFRRVGAAKFVRICVCICKRAAC